MVRKNVIAKKRGYKCPVCPRQAYSLRGVAQHLAMRQDEKHTSWRTGHGLPKRCKKISEVMKITRKIVEILVENETTQLVK